MKTTINEQFLDVDKESSVFKVSRSTFVRPDLLEREYEQIFDKCWLYLGHVSELSKPGDFVTRTVARRNILFTRDSKGELNAFLNVCPHRGATVCREPSGNAKNFQCFYHGWIFGNNGQLKSQAGAEHYSDACKKSDCNNLTAVPRFDVFAGFCFISFDPDIISLPDYLADAKDYLELISKQSESGMAIVSGSQEYSIRANWKLLVENSVDGYHAVTTHASYFDYIKNTNGGLNPEPLAGRSLDLGNGHAVLEYSAPWGRPIAQWIPLFGEEGKHEMDELYARLVELHGEELAERMARKNRNLLIYPNLVINDIMAVTVRTFYPEAPDYMLINGWALAPREETERARKYRLYNFLEFLGPGGFATPDDVEALEACQKGFQNYRLAQWNDISKGMHKEQPAYDDEQQMRVFWTRWNEQMRVSDEAED